MYISQDRSRNRHSRLPAIPVPLPLIIIALVAALITALVTSTIVCWLAGLADCLGRDYIGSKGNSDIAGAVDKRSRAVDASDRVGSDLRDDTARHLGDRVGDHNRLNFVSGVHLAGIGGDDYSLGSGVDDGDGLVGRADAGIDSSVVGGVHFCFGDLCDRGVWYIGSLRLISITARRGDYGSAHKSRNSLGSRLSYRGRGVVHGAAGRTSPTPVTFTMITLSTSTGKSKGAVIRQSLLKNSQRNISTWWREERMLQA